MKHFIAGWAIGTLVGGTVMAWRARSGKLIDFYIWAGLIIGPLAGLSLWGILP